MTSRPLIALLAAACALVAAVGAFASSGGGSETVLLAPGDVATAKKIALQKADIGPGWTRDRSSSSSESSGSIGGSGSSDGSCALNVDLSKFTISGHAGADYKQDHAFLSSEVLVFPTAAEATGDLAANMSAAARKCIADAIAKAWDGVAKQKPSENVRFEVTSTRTFPSSNYKGLHAAHVYAFALTGRFVGPGGSAPISTAILAFTKGRVQVILFGISGSHEPMDMSPLAKRMLGRFPGKWEIST